MVHGTLVEYDGSGSPLAHYTHSTLGADDVLAVEVSSAGVTAQLAQATGVYTYLKDSLGSIVDVTDTNGNRVQHHVYSAFGTELAILNGAGADVTSAPPLRTSYGFTGRELDRESGLMYYRARYYLPETWAASATSSARTPRYLRRETMLQLPLPCATGVARSSSLSAF